MDRLYTRLIVNVMPQNKGTYLECLLNLVFVATGLIPPLRRLWG
jgi:hypothetical protein